MDKKEMSIHDIKIIGIFGKNNELGEGKTILSTFWALKDNKENIPVHADYKLPFGIPISYFSEIDESFAGSSVYIDDIIPFLDCRDSSNNINETWVLTQLRKFKLRKFIYTSQMKGAIDGRLRRISNMIVETEQIKFPKFHLWFYSKNIDLIEDFDIVYGREVSEIYDTYELVKRKVSLVELTELFEEYDNKVAFRLIAKIKFAFKNNMSDTIFTLLEKGDIKLIEKLFKPYGYTLVY